MSALNIISRRLLWSLPLILLVACSGEQEADQAMCPGGTSKRTLSVMTYNVHLFDIAHVVTRAPVFKNFVQDAIDMLLTGSGSKSVDFLEEERTHHIADRLLALKDPPEILVMTELWSDDLADQLYRKIKTIYPSHFRPESNAYIFDGTVFGSGLSIFSRFPFYPESKNFNPFSKLVGADKHSVKGVAQVSVQVCEGPKVTVFGSHLQAVDPNDASSLDVVHHNVQELAQAIVQHHQKNPDEAIIVAGDLNLPEKEPNYKKMMVSLGVWDAFRALHSDAKKSPGFTYDSTRNGLISVFLDVDPKAPYQERLDYILFKPGRTLKKVLGATEEGGSFEFYDPATAKTYPLSDHYPVRVDFELS
jgi:hypothetical protein